MARDCQTGGSARTRDAPNKFDNIHYCLRMGCDAQLTSVDASYEDLKIHFECEGGHSGAKCLTELATSDL